LFVPQVSQVNFVFCLFVVVEQNFVVFTWTNVELPQPSVAIIFYDGRSQQNNSSIEHFIRFQKREILQSWMVCGPIVMSAISNIIC
jgi:hypothetical protein